MAGTDAVVIRFQCPKCGYELEQTIASLKLSDHMSCKGCGVGINIDTNRLANAADEIQSAIDKIPPEITIKIFSLISEPLMQTRARRRHALLQVVGANVSAIMPVRRSKRCSDSRSLPPLQLGRSVHVAPSAE